MMRRRNGEVIRKRPTGPFVGKRPGKSSTAESFLSAGVTVYLKLVGVWSLVLFGDYLFGNFRLEYIWPIWLCISSVIDAYRYQGWGFAMFFISIVITSDVICFLLVPVRWLFAVASSYVWLQYVINSDRGICPQSILLWLCFIYVEMTIRVNDIHRLLLPLSTTSSSGSATMAAFSSFLGASSAASNIDGKGGGATNSNFVGDPSNLGASPPGLPLHLELCRPLAAHCAGYPVVTVSFGLKSYLSYRMKKSRQRLYAKENQRLKDLLLQSLPEDVQQQQRASLLSTFSCSNGELVPSLVNCATSPNSSPSHKSTISVSGQNMQNVSQESGFTNDSVNGFAENNSSWPLFDRDCSRRNGKHKDSSARGCTKLSKSSSLSNNNTSSNSKSKQNRKTTQPQIRWLTKIVSFLGLIKLPQLSQDSSESFCGSSAQQQSAACNEYMSSSSSSSKKCKAAGGANNNNNASAVMFDDGDEDNVSVGESESGSAPVCSLSSRNHNVNDESAVHEKVQLKAPINGSGKKGADSERSGRKHRRGASSGGAGGNQSSTTSNGVSNTLEEQQQQQQFSAVYARLEMDIKRLKADLQSSRQTEQDLRNQLQKMSLERQTFKSEASLMQKQNDALQQKLHELVTARQKEKKELLGIEKRLNDEKGRRSDFEKQLEKEKRARKNDEADASKRDSDIDKMRGKYSELEQELRQARHELKIRDDELKQHSENVLRMEQYKTSQKDTDVLLSALSAMQDKNAHLENSLAAETKLKLELFVAYGEVKREMDYAKSSLVKKEAELSETKDRLKKMTEVMALIPSNNVPSAWDASSPSSDATAAAAASVSSNTSGFSSSGTYSPSNNFFSSFATNNGVSTTNDATNTNNLFTSDFSGTFSTSDSADSVAVKRSTPSPSSVPGTSCVFGTSVSSCNQNTW